MVLVVMKSQIMNQILILDELSILFEMVRNCLKISVYSEMGLCLSDLAVLINRKASWGDLEGHDNWGGWSSLNDVTLLEEGSEISDHIVQKV